MEELGFSYDPSSEFLLPENTLAVDIWFLLHAGRGLTRSGELVYSDVLETAIAMGGSDSDILRILTVEAIYLGANNVKSRKTGNRNNRNNNRATGGK